MPAAIVISKRPTETRDAPTFKPCVLEKIIAESQISLSLNLDFFRITGQLILTRYEVAGDVPTFGATRISLSLHCRHFCVNDLVRRRKHPNTTQTGGKQQPPVTETSD